MRIEKTKNAMKNITAGMILRIYQMIVPFLMRTAMIYIMGVQYLGLNSLFVSVIQVLSLAELGVGNAMVFAMYKPIAQDDEKTICALMNLYRRYYRITGLVIGAVGLMLTPMVPHLISGDVPGGDSAGSRTGCLCPVFPEAESLCGSQVSGPEKGCVPDLDQDHHRLYSRWCTGRVV